MTRTDDCSGRGQQLNDHDHLKWLAAKVQDNGERLARIEEMLAEMASK